MVNSVYYTSTIAKLLIDDRINSILTYKRTKRFAKYELLMIDYMSKQQIMMYIVNKRAVQVIALIVRIYINAQRVQIIQRS